MTYNILIVDDERYTLEDIESCIDKDALSVGRVFTALNTTRARQILDDETIHIILSDIDMPGGSGIDFMRSVRDTDADTPCIFITNYADFSYAKEAIHLKVLDYMLKPVDPDDLNRILKKAEEIVDLNCKEEAPAAVGADAPAPETASPEDRPVCQKSQYISAAVSFIGDNLTNDVTRESVSDHVHLTPDHLDRLFREHFGMSAFKYIVARKIEFAEKILAESDQLVSTIASELGYCNLSNFSSAFKKQTGLTPAEYRKNHMGS